MTKKEMMKWIGNETYEKFIKLDNRKWCYVGYVTGDHLKRYDRFITNVETDIVFIYLIYTWLDGTIEMVRLKKI